MRKVACANTYINKIKPVIRKTSFSQLKIDEIAKYMDISKATLYKRFSSKDEIIEAVVEDFMNYLLEGMRIIKMKVCLLQNVSKRRLFTL